MSILRNRVVKKREGYRLVGVSIPLQDHNFLTMYSLVNDTTKSKILQRMISKWLRVTRIPSAEKELVETLIRRAKVRWKTEASGQNLTFKQFQEMLRHELENKGISEPYLSQILNGVTK